MKANSLKAFILAAALSNLSTAMDVNQSAPPNKSGFVLQGTVLGSTLSALGTELDASANKATEPLAALSRLDQILTQRDPHKKIGIILMGILRGVNGRKLMPEDKSNRYALCKDTAILIARCAFVMTKVIEYTTKNRSTGAAARTYGAITNEYYINFISDVSQINLCELYDLCRRVRGLSLGDESGEKVLLLSLSKISDSENKRKLCLDALLKLFGKYIGYKDISKRGLEALAKVRTNSEMSYVNAALGLIKANGVSEYAKVTYLDYLDHLLGLTPEQLNTVDLHAIPILKSTSGPHGYYGHDIITQLENASPLGQGRVSFELNEKTYCIKDEYRMWIVHSHKDCRGAFSNTRFAEIKFAEYKKEGNKNSFYYNCYSEYNCTNTIYQFYITYFDPDNT